MGAVRESAPVENCFTGAFCGSTGRLRLPYTLTHEKVILGGFHETQVEAVKASESTGV